MVRKHSYAYDGSIVFDPARALIEGYTRPYVVQRSHTNEYNFRVYPGSYEIQNDRFCVAKWTLNRWKH